MAGTVATIVLLALGVLFARAFGFRQVQPWTKHLETLQVFLTIAAVAIGAVWYFFERPQAAKLDLSQTVNAVPLEGGSVLLLIEVSPKNLGGTLLDFTKSPYSIEVGQVTPLTVTPYREATTQPVPGRPRKIWAGERWSPLAKISYAPMVGRGDRPAEEADDGPALTSFIEAGETENLYFRVVIPCKPLLRVYVISRFEKPQMPWEQGDPRISWVKQTFVDLSASCPLPTTSPPAHPKRRTK